MLCSKRLRHSLSTYLSSLFKTRLKRSLLSSAPIHTQNQPSTSSSPIDHLVEYCNFSTEDLQKAAKSINFLRQKGFTDDDVHKFATIFPSLLRRDLAETLEPRIRLLQDQGFSIPEISRLISANPSALRISDLAPKLEFWRTLLANKVRFLKVLSDSHVLNASLDRKIKPNVSFLKETGLPEHRICRILSRRPRLITCRLETIKALVEQVNSHGISATAGMFEQAFYAVANISKSKFEDKLKLFLDFGWSKEDFTSAFQRSPLVLRVSEKKIKLAMEFLLQEAGFDSSYVALRPVLLSYSLEKRLIPRHSVLRILRSRSISAGEHDFLGAVVLPEKKFLKRYVLTFRERIPGLLEFYFEAVKQGVKTEEC